MEVWKPVVDHPRYEVSDMGRVQHRARTYLFSDGSKQHQPARILHGSTITPANPYKRVGIDGEQLKLHRLVAEAFIGPEPEGHPPLTATQEKRLAKEADLCAHHRPIRPCWVCDHIDGDRSNNKAENLEWISQSENVLRARIRGVTELSPRIVDGSSPV